MNILMIAPEPFFQYRGTPISVYFRIKALSCLGHKIDLVTYHLGEDVLSKNLQITRTPRIVFIKKIKIGPSFVKIVLDFLLFLKAFSQLLKKRYDLIFSHEEAAIMGVVLSKIWQLPHLYDMHSSLPQQLKNFNFTNSKLLINLFLVMEKYVLKNSHAILVICQDLKNQVQKEGFESKSILLENFLDFPKENLSKKQIELKRKKLASIGEKIVLYVGNFQPYQGIPLFLEAAKRIDNHKVKFLLVGGNKTNREKMKKLAKSLKISKKTVFAGEVPPSQVHSYISIADVLVSPRIAGTNTPLKIYSFLKSGKPIVATDLWTHSQILNNSMAILVKPDPKNLAEGISFALFDKEAKKRAAEAKKYADKHYTYSIYKQRLKLSLETALKHKGET